MRSILTNRSKRSQSSDSSQSSGWHLRLEVFWIRKASLTTDIVPVTAQIALRIMGIAMEGGIMGMIIHTAVSLAEIKAEADCKHRMKTNALLFD